MKIIISPRKIREYHQMGSIVCGPATLKHSRYFRGSAICAGPKRYSLCAVYYRHSTLLRFFRYNLFDSSPVLSPRERKTVRLIRRKNRWLKRRLDSVARSLARMLMLLRSSWKRSRGVKCNVVRCPVVELRTKLARQLDLWNRTRLLLWRVN